MSRPGGLFELYRDVNVTRLDPIYVDARYGSRSALAGLFKRGAAFFRKMLRSLAAIGASGGWRTGLTASGIVLFTSTPNQTHALRKLASHLPDCLWVTYNQAPLADAPAQAAVPDILVHLIALLTLPLSLAFALHYWAQGGPGGERRARARQLAFASDEVARTLAYRLVGRAIVHRLGARQVVMSNDHNSINRAICLACRGTGVRTVYVQHAPVSEYFPDLLFDAALVDGDHAATIYADKATHTAISVTGAGRYETQRTRPPLAELDRPPRLSLAFNKIDRPKLFLDYLAAARAAGFEPLVRPHPGMTPADLRFLPSDAVLDRRSAAEHLADIDVLIAGSSGLLLDAFMAGVVPIAAADLPVVEDHYGFIRHGAVFSCTLATVGRLLADYRTLDIAALRDGMAFYNAALRFADGPSPAERQARFLLAGPI